MTDAEIARAMKAEILKAETALARVSELATDDFRARQDADLRAKAEAAHKRATKSLTALHGALTRAGKKNDDIVAEVGK